MPDRRAQLEALRQIVDEAKSLPTASLDRRAVLDETHRLLSEIRARIEHDRAAADPLALTELEAQERAALALEAEVKTRLREDHPGSASHLQTEIRGAAEAGFRLYAAAPNARGMWGVVRREDPVTRGVLIGGTVVGLGATAVLLRSLWRKAGGSRAGRWLKRAAVVAAGAVGILWLWNLLRNRKLGTGRGSGGAGGLPEGAPAGDAKDEPGGEAKPELGNREEGAGKQRLNDHANGPKDPAGKRAERTEVMPAETRERELAVVKDGGINTLYHRERLPSAKTVRIQILGGGTDPRHPGDERGWAIQDGYGADGTPKWHFHTKQELLTRFRVLHEQGQLEHVHFYVLGKGWSLPALAHTSGSADPPVTAVLTEIGVPVTVAAEGPHSRDTKDLMTGPLKNQAAVFEGEAVMDPATGKPLPPGGLRPGSGYIESDPESYRVVYLPTEEQYLRSLCPEKFDLLPGDVRRAPVVKVGGVAEPMTMRAFLRRCAVQPKVRAIHLVSDPDRPGVPECRRLVVATGRIFVTIPKNPAAGGGRYRFVARQVTAK